MKHAIAIARRDVSERSFVILAAAIFGVLPFLAVLLPSVRRFGTSEVIITLAVFITSAFTVGTAIVLGSSMVGRDLTEKRLSFYFSRPASAASIWFGKVLAAVALIVSAFVLTFLPAFAFAREAWSSGWRIDVATVFGVLLGGSFVLFLLAHTIGTMVRSKSALIGADFLLLLAAAAGVWFVLRPLIFGLAFELLRAVAIALGAVLVAILLAAGSWQLARGRVDRRANHRALSTFLWSAVAVAIVLAGMFVAWVVATGPEDVAALNPTGAGGSWAVVTGEMKHRGDFRETFIYNVDTGRSVKIGCGFCEVDFSRDGRSAMWFRPNEFKSLRGELHVMRIDGAEPRPVNTGIEVNMASTPLAFNDDATRMAFVNAGLLSVVEIPSGRTVGVVRMPVEKGRWRVTFADGGKVRVYVAHADAIHIMEFDAQTRRLETTGIVPLETSSFVIWADGAAKTILVRQKGDVVDGKAAYRSEIRDGRTGAILHTLDSGDGFPQLLTDGRVVVREQRPDGMWFHLLTGGVRTRSVNVGRVDRASVKAELSPAKLLVTGTSGPDEKKWTTFVVDVERGIIERSEELRPMEWWPYSYYDPRRTNTPSTAFIGADGNLIRFDPLTGEKRTALKIR